MPVQLQEQLKTMPVQLQEQLTNDRHGPRG
jgi:hypothetical protein